MRKFLTALFLLASSFALAQENDRFISQYRDAYFTTGIPLDRAVDWSSADIKFQISMKLKPFDLKNDWRCFFGYTQISVWNFFSESSPFKDNSYMPGFYFEKRYSKGDRLTLGVEHRSNGRPYYGNPVTDGTFDDYSRGMNYLYASWMKPVGHSSYGIDAKFGISSGVQEYPEKVELFSFDLFLYYLGIATFNYNYSDKRFHAGASVTPIINKSIANVTLDASYRLFKKYPLSFYAQFHYGFDEALCDCVRDTAPPVNLRFGLILR